MKDQPIIMQKYPYFIEVEEEKSFIIGANA